MAEPEGPLVQVVLPEIEYVDPRQLKFDKHNPNRMNKGQRSALRESLVRYGFFIPIVTNRDMLVADGQQRAEEAMDLRLPKVPIVRLDVKDVDRRLLRQILNKLKGTHDPRLDAAEYARIIEAGNKDDLLKFLQMRENTLKAALKLVRPPLDPNSEEGRRILAHDITNDIDPFSVFDGRAPKWRARTEEWLKLIPLHFATDNRTNIGAGDTLYNDAIYVQPLGTAMQRENIFTISRKLIKVHDNVLVFYKGDPSQAKQAAQRLNAGIKGGKP